ncbi:chromate transporter [Bacillus sp. LL01]|uniref:chromate transporter n=1 Tax=Bacillus sp. LL01 TaxID=1665556 RepID=UPI00064D289E|nr:chromate transporter [Bacillus sp. LL01]KMJ56100.1 chromate transporter [Bacillus sp. LL01]
MFWKTQLDIFIAFFRSGILGYGGGPSTIPLVHKEVVGHFKWMTDEEFADVLAIGNTLPGPIATKMAGHIGYQVGGIVGLLNAIVATVLPTVVGMIALIGVLSNYRDSSVVAGMTQAVTPVVGIMMIVMTYQFLKQSKKGIGLTQTLVLAVISAVAFELIGIHPALVIGVLLIYGLVMGGKRREEQKETKKRNVSG